MKALSCLIVVALILSGCLSRAERAAKQRAMPIEAQAVNFFGNTCIKTAADQEKLEEIIQADWIHHGLGRVLRQERIAQVKLADDEVVRGWSLINKVMGTENTVMVTRRGACVVYLQYSDFGILKKEFENITQRLAKAASGTAIPRENLRNSDKRGELFAYHIDNPDYNIGPDIALVKYYKPKGAAILVLRRAVLDEI